MEDKFDEGFAEAELLKKSCVVSSVADVRTKWHVRQQLQDKYRSLLLSNLERSIKRGVEMDLWRYTWYLTLEDLLHLCSFAKLLY